MQSRGGEVREQGSFAGGEDGRQPATVLCEAGAADEIDTAVDPVQAPFADPARHCPLPKPQAFELGSGDETVLAGGDLGHAASYANHFPFSLTFVPISGTFVSEFGHGATFAAGDARVWHEVRRDSHATLPRCKRRRQRRPSRP